MENPDWQRKFSRETKLHALGLTEALLAPAIDAYRDALAKAGPYHPPGHGGITAYGEAIAALGQELVPMGWSSCRRLGWCRWVSPNEMVSIFVSSGDGHTGLEDLEPSSRYEKGPATRHAVRENGFLAGFQAPQLLLPFEGAEPKKARPPIFTAGCWCLLFKETRGELRTELSLPIACDEKGFVCTWGDRIILDATAADVVFEIESSPDVDFDIGLEA